MPLFGLLLFAIGSSFDAHRRPDTSPHQHRGGHHGRTIGAALGGAEPAGGPKAVLDQDLGHPGQHERGGEDADFLGSAQFMARDKRQ